MEISQLACELSALCGEHLVEGDVVTAARLLWSPETGRALPENLVPFRSGTWFDELISLAVIELAAAASADPQRADAETLLSRVRRAMAVLYGRSPYPELENCHSVEELAWHVIEQSRHRAFPDSTVRLACHMVVFGTAGGSYGGYLPEEPPEGRTLAQGLVYEAMLDLHAALADPSGTRAYVAVARSALMAI
jgi:hypothetical protein